MFSSSRGSSIVQIMVMMGVVSIILSASLTMVQRARVDQKNVVNKIEHRATQALVKDIMSRSSECNCQVAGKKFNLNATDKSFSLNSLKASCSPGAPILISTSLVVINNKLTADSMVVNNITPTSNANEYTGELNVGFQVISNNTTRRLKADPIKFTFYTDPASPDNAKLVLGCGRSPLIAPADLAAAAGPASSTCTINWNEASGAKPITYTVRGGTTAGKAENGNKICQVLDSTTCAISGLTNDVKHYFAIQASTSTQGATTYSAEVTCTPLLAASKPVLNSPVAGDSKCSLSWPSSSGSAPLTYTVYQSTTLPVTKDSSKVCNKISGTSCTANELTNGTTYYYAAVASNGLGDSSLSSPVSCSPCPANHHTVGGTCIQTFKIENQALAQLGKNTPISQALGKHHYCVLTGFTYDGSNEGSCKISGAVDGNWSVIITDEDTKDPQICIVSCSTLDMTGVDPNIGSICPVGGKTGIRKGSCCAVGTFSDKDTNNDIECK